MFPNLWLTNTITTEGIKACGLSFEKTKTGKKKAHHPCHACLVENHLIWSQAELVLFKYPEQISTTTICDMCAHH